MAWTPVPVSHRWEQPVSTATALVPQTLLQRAVRLAGAGILVVPSAAAIAGVATAVGAQPAGAVTCPTCHTFTTSGTFTVPTGVTHLYIEVTGASGGNGSASPNISGGTGGR